MAKFSSYIYIYIYIFSLLFQQALSTPYMKSGAPMQIQQVPFVHKDTAIKSSISFFVSLIIVLNKMLFSFK